MDLKFNVKALIHIKTLTVGIFLASLCLFRVYAAESATAVSMRLSCAEGTVNVSGQGGKKMEIVENMRLHSGYALETEENSYAGLMLDDSKAAKMDALSRGEVRKQGEKLEFLLSSGSLMCDVQTPLKADETFQIRTSTMITGIRGTVLYVRVIDAFTSAVYVLEGRVLMQAPNPATGEMFSLYVEQGQMGIARTDKGTTGGIWEGGIWEGGAWNGRNWEGGNPQLYVEGFSKEDIDGYVLMHIAGDPKLQERLKAAEWDTDWMISNGPERLRQDQEAALSGRKPPEEDRREILVPLFPDSGSDSGNSSDRNTARGTVTLPSGTPPAEINERLRTSDVIIERAGTSAGGADVNLSGVTVPGSGRLYVGNSVTAQVESGSVLQVDGTMETAGDLENNGTIFNTSWNTLRVGGHYNAGGGRLDNTGRVEINGNLMVETGAVMSANGQLDVQGIAKLSQSQFEFGQGSIMKGVTLNQSDLTMTGGRIRSGGSEYGIKTENSSKSSHSNITLCSGTVYGDSGSNAAVYMSGGDLVIEDNILRVQEEAIPFVEGSGTLYLGDNGDDSFDISQVGENESAKEALKHMQGSDGWEMGYFALAPKALLMMNPELPIENERLEADTATPSNAAPKEDAEDTAGKDTEAGNDEEAGNTEGGAAGEESGEAGGGTGGEESGESAGGTGGEESGEGAGGTNGEESGESAGGTGGEESGEGAGGTGGEEPGESAGGTGGEGSGESAGTGGEGSGESVGTGDEESGESEGAGGTGGEESGKIIGETDGEDPGEAREETGDKATVEP